GIVDVPGHRDFVENMLAGAGGIDAAIFVVAADEGVMPQTREHLAILNLLKIPGGVVALTKTDLVDDPDWLDLVTTDVMETLEGTMLENAPIVPVSARTGAGLEDLAVALQDVLEHTAPRLDRGHPRLWIDRVFTISGFGTVVTGTLLDGAFEKGQEVSILPQDRRARIRGLQTHKKKIQRALPGSRVAINLSGVSKDDLDRGNLVTLVDWLHPTILVDVRLDYLLEAGRPLQHNTYLKFFCGSAEVLGRVRLLGEKALAPGDSGWVQFELESPLPLVRGDRFIVRTPSPAETVGGGSVVDPNPGRKHRRFRPEVIERLETLAQGTPVDVLSQALQRHGPLAAEALLEASGLGEAAPEALDALVADGQAVVLAAEQALAPGRLLVSRGWWSAMEERMSDALEAHHSRYPLRSGMGREALRSALRLEARAFNGLMARASKEDVVVEEGATVRLPGHQIRFNPEQQRAVDALLARFRNAPYVPPSVKESAAAVGEDVLVVLLNRGDLVQVSPDVLFLPAIYTAMVQRIREHVQKHGSITLGQTRDLFDTSRKYAQGLLEHLDATGVTQRVGDERVLKS
ncbi:MAG: selenocysteine-specific translation elongation factor, partial [Anaerolineae bacterium]|nr:selenocysteine-specific translation elongation factor [Anaerolineae bacterium]